MEQVQNVCPSCSSPNIGAEQTGYQQFVFSCYDCGYRFAIPKEISLNPQPVETPPPKEEPSSKLSGYITFLILGIIAWGVLGHYRVIPHDYTLGLALENVTSPFRPQLMDLPQPEIEGKPLLAHIIPEPAPNEDIRQYILGLTNQHRHENGLKPVRAGHNRAAQVHADNALNSCYSAHWDLWGLKPNHRYTLTGGTGTGKENVAGNSYCIKRSEFYESIRGNLDKEAKDIVDGWMESPGHRRNILNPAHTILNIGLAWNNYNIVAVQQFSSDYIRFSTKPNISSEGTLSFAGSVTGASLSIGNTTNFTLQFDLPPSPLTPGQLSYTYSLCNSYRIASIQPIGIFSLGSKYTTEEGRCIDPYEINPALPPPASIKEAQERWAQAKINSSGTKEIPSLNVDIHTRHYSLNSNFFDVAADINEILDTLGPGIYTLTIWGMPNHMNQPAVLSQQAIFWKTTPPEGHPYNYP